ncbi:hypothetical protein FHE72_23440 (plasmid) [Rossellomorea vietnamensis]|uniref:Uncharacterized protein n=1 Tax=Rossellomorea vietnamensis TaxID=218284 RepID=A0A6I6UPT6_9BACI|nr:hypothetical protein [Rossellomorea vietnamensis]QHE63948.1 hypothetical protein FHE72_23440 [Rossellomorea vietnamensis]
MKHKPIAPIFLNDPVEKRAAARPSNSRKTRFDKTAPMKFPVTEEENIKLRRLFQSFNRNDKGIRSASITELFVMLVRFGLRHQEMLRPADEYQNTVIKKTVKPNQLEKRMIEDLAIEWNVSERRALHGIVFSVINYLDRGGSLVYEKVQPFRPNE